MMSKFFGYIKKSFFIQLIAMTIVHHHRNSSIMLPSKKDLNVILKTIIEFDGKIDVLMSQ